MTCDSGRSRSLDVRSSRRDPERRRGCWRSADDGLIEIGAHSVTHPRSPGLRRLGPVRRRSGRARPPARPSWSVRSRRSPIRTASIRRRRWRWSAPPVSPAPAPRDADIVHRPQPMPHSCLGCTLATGTATEFEKRLTARASYALIAGRSAPTALWPSPGEELGVPFQTPERVEHGRRVSPARRVDLDDPDPGRRQIVDLCRQDLELCPFDVELDDRGVRQDRAPGGGPDGGCRRGQRCGRSPLVCTHAMPSASPPAASGHVPVSHDTIV